MRKNSATLGGNTGAFIAGGAAFVALALGAYIGFGRIADEPTAAPEPSQTTPQTQATAPDPTEAVRAPDAPLTPGFDEVRRESDGTTIIAGRAAPSSKVQILVDGTEIATVTADSTGGFAAITSLPPQKDGQIVSLSSQVGEEVATSREEIILAPAPKVPEPPLTQSETVDADETRQDQRTQQTATATEETDAEAPRVAVLKSDADGVTLLQPASPQAMTSVALDTIGYSDIGAVQLSGRAQADTAQVRVYLDNRAIVSLPVDSEGRWQGDLPDVDEGVYTLRVDEVDAQGSVSSRVQTPFKRESAQTLADAAADTDGPLKSITVQTGATLWAIARDRYGDGTLYVRVFEANAANIRDPDLIYPGQVFDLPN